MCSIIGYIGKTSAASVLVESLKKMEYRGYDSVGIATLENNKILVRKGVGKVLDVDHSLQLYKMPGQIGIGHTRWATHGGINKSNAHPHTDCENNVVVVHNGIIGNYKQLKHNLIKQGHIFQSQTDSEVIAHLIEIHLKRFDIKQAIIETCKQIEGSYSFVAIFKSGIVAGTRLDEPLIIGIGKDGNFISSDVLGFLEYTDKAIFLDNHDIVILDNQDIHLFDFDGSTVSRPITQVAWELGDIDKGKYAHYTIKEIHEQKNSIPLAFAINSSFIKRAVDNISSSTNIFITGSGTSYHSALLAKYLFYKFAKIRTEVIMSSEFEYVPGFIDENSLLIAISQSGETADVLHSVKIAKQHKAKILSIVNITTSSLCRLSNHYIPLNCGPEIGVAATKSFTAQLAVIYSIINNFCKNKTLDISTDTFSNVLNEILKDDLYLETIAEDIKSVRDIYILGSTLR